jgi:hypothetical protein
MSNFNGANLNTIIHLSSMQLFLVQSTTQMQQTPMVCDAAQEKCYSTRKGYYVKIPPNS